MFGGAFYLRRNHASRIPSTILTIGVSAQTTGGNGARNCYGERLALAVGESVRLERGRATRHHRISTDSPRELWCWARSVCSSGRSNWLFMYRGLRCATLADLWSEIESDRFTLWDRAAGSDSAGKRVSKGDRRRRGYLCAESELFLGTLRAGAGRLNLVDLRNYLREPIGEIARWCNIPPINLDDDAPLGELRLRSAEWECRVVMAAAQQILLWWRSVDQGNFRMTASGLAWSSFRHSHMRHKVLVHKDGDVQALEQASFVGGKVGVRWVGYWPGWCADGAGSGDNEGGGIVYCRSGPVYQIDFRSHYPAVMRDGLFPIQLRGAWRGIRPDALGRRMGGYGCVASVRVSGRENEYPCVRGNKKMHRSGSFWTTLAGPELTRALEHGEITAVDHYALYSLAPLFKDYVDYWFSARMEAKRQGNALWDRFCKAMLDSLYGRFAMRARRWLDRPDIVPPVEWGAWRWQHPTDRTWHAMRSIGGFAQQMQRAGWAESSCVAIAAYVTSYGRVVLDSLIHSLPERSVLYYDTDGALVTQAAHDHLTSRDMYHPDQLGGLRCVRRIDSGEIVGPRHYRIGTDTVRAGLANDHMETTAGGSFVHRPQSGAEVLASRPDGSFAVVAGRFGFGKGRDPGPIDWEGFVIDEPLIEEG